MMKSISLHTSSKIIQRNTTQQRRKMIISDVDCSIDIRECTCEASVSDHDVQRSNGDASHTTCSSHDGFTTILSDNDFMQRNVQPPPDITTLEREPPGQNWNWKRMRFLSIYFLTITILFSDVNLMAPNLSIIAEEFGFDDDERDIKLGGMIALGFFFIGAPASYVIGWLADSMNRTPLFAATVFIGEIGCMMVYFVQTYQQLYVCRVLTGISIGGAMPIVFSVLGDLYPASKRSVVAAIVTTGSGIGMGIGQVIAGLLPDWRLPFLIVSIPGILCSFTILFFDDPPRGANEEAVLQSLNESNNHSIHHGSTLSQESDGLPVAHVDHLQSLQNCGMNCDASKVQIDTKYEKPTLAGDLNLEIVETKSDTNVAFAPGDVARNVLTSPNRIIANEASCKATMNLLKTPSVVLIIIQAAPGSLPFGFCATFLNDMLQQQKGMTKEAATSVLVTFGAGNAIGVILGGFLGRFYKKDVRLPPLFMGASLILGCIPFYFLINHVHEGVNPGVSAAITVISGALVVIPVPLERAILTNVCLPRSRGRANALVSIVDDLGKGLGPALVSMLITTFDRQTAFNISLGGWVIGGIISLFIIIFVAADEEKIQQQLREQMAHDVAVDTGEA